MWAEKKKECHTMHMYGCVCVWVCVVLRGREVEPDTHRIMTSSAIALKGVHNTNEGGHAVPEQSNEAPVSLEVTPAARLSTPRAEPPPPPLRVPLVVMNEKKKRANFTQTSKEEDSAHTNTNSGTTDTNTHINLPTYRPLRCHLHGSSRLFLDTKRWRAP